MNHKLNHEATKTQRLFNLFEAEAMLVDGLAEDVTDGIDIVELDVADNGASYICVYLRGGDEGQRTQSAMPEFLEMNGQRIDVHCVPAVRLN